MRQRSHHLRGAGTLARHIMRPTNEFLKEHRKGEEQDRTIAELKAHLMQQQVTFEKAIGQLQSAVKEQAAQIQKVTAQIDRK